MPDHRTTGAHRMSAETAPRLPPALPGFDYLESLGSGGFADVYLFEQHLPRRPVAIKVLTASELDEKATERFRDEANLMARLSSHPSIVAVYQAGIAGTGEPYLVMEYCAQPGYGQRFRRETLSVEEVLSVGVQIAGAVETAHRAGILHRDIKPANILVTDYRRPALTDFGISATMGQAQHVDALSAPWAAPEVLGDEAVPRTSSDIYSLAATVYTLLAGRAPFEVPGGDNSFEALRARARSMPAPPTGRPDAPPSLEAALATALSTSPAARQTSALSLGRAFQQVQQQLGLAVTPIDVPSDPFAQRSFEDSRVRPATSALPATAPLPPTSTLPATVPLYPTAPTELVPAAAAEQTPTAFAALVTPPPTPGAAPLESTVRRETTAAPIYIAPLKKKSVWPGIVVDIVLVLAVAGAATFWFIGG
ncbi:serine/threonine-protein kinase [soil metagenome]